MKRIHNKEPTSYHLKLSDRQFKIVIINGRSNVVRWHKDHIAICVARNLISGT